MRSFSLSFLLALLLASVLATPAPAAVVWAVGDGGVPEPEDDAVAARIQQEGLDHLLYLGDVYEHGTAQEFRDNYGPSFGRFRSVSHPTPGNHEWGNRATGYDPYWGSRAPQNGGHYYSFDIEGWHVISLNSLEDHGPGSAQVAWLKRDLARYPGTCTIAFWHDPRYSAGPHSEETSTEALWAPLVGRAVMVLSGHDHNYQRFKPNRGVTQWVVGTGGRGLYETNQGDSRLAASNDTEHGALKLRLDPGRAGYEFVTSAGARRDSGSVPCTPHSSAPPPSPSPTPTPPPSPGGPGPTPPPSGGQPGTTPPPAGRARVRVASLRRNRTYSRRRARTIRGTASLPGRSAVQLTLTHRRRGVCRSWDGRRFRRARCARPPLFSPRGGERWSVRLPARKLRKGRYRLTARVRSSSGVLARAAVSFRIR